MLPKNFPKSFLLPFFFYLITFACDASITTYGISNKLGSEGNPVVIWLWSIFGQDSFVLKVIYVFIIFSVSYFIYKKINKFIGILIPYSLGVGHLLGFSTWILGLNNHFNSEIFLKIDIFLGIYGFFFVALAGGIILSLLHKKFLIK